VTNRNYNRIKIKEDRQSGEATSNEDERTRIIAQAAGFVFATDSTRLFQKLLRMFLNAFAFAGTTD
jgi:hypothetical protein